jgi:hypothetical protein
MPAVQISRLRLQAGRLRDHFFQPVVFVQKLRELLASYADNTHRPGRSGMPKPILHAYNVPFPVLRQMVVEISPLADQYPQESFALIDELWKQENLECRHLAIIILGRLTVDSHDPLLERVYSWTKNSETTVIDLVMEHGLKKFRQEAPIIFFKTVENWLISRNWYENRLGLRALIPALKDGSAADLPFIYRALTPTVRSLQTILKPEVSAVFRQLALLSPVETTYYLKQNMNHPSVPWLARQILPDLPSEQQDSLRKALKRIEPAS